MSNSAKLIHFPAQDYRPPGLRPRVVRCGNHWACEYNRKGDYYPIETCHRTWQEAVDRALWAAKNGKHATEEVV